MEESWKCFNSTLLLTVMAVVFFFFFSMLDSKSNYIPGADDYVYDNQKEKNLVVLWPRLQDGVSEMAFILPNGLQQVSGHRN